MNRFKQLVGGLLTAAPNFGAGIARGATADVLGTPVDTLNAIRQGLLMPAEAGNPVAQQAMGLLGPVQQTGSSDWIAAQMGLPAGQGMAYEAGRMLSPSPSDLLSLARRAPSMQEIITYHGTPHRFPATEANPLGEFDASKIGAGEGAQMYGHGIYLAEAPGAAKTYKTAGSDAAYKRVTGGMDPMEEFAFDLATQGMTGEDLFSGMSQKYGKFLKSDEDFDRFDAAIKKAESAVGNLYTADLPDEMIDRMLDWDKPLSEQPENVQNVLREMWVKAKKSFSGIDEKANPIAGQIHYAYAQHRGGNASTVAEELRQKGIPGIKYLDQGSRDSGEGTRNFVIFPGEEKKVKILERK
jgi:hypothetical protein